MLFEGFRRLVAVTRASLASERAMPVAQKRHRDDIEFLPASIEVMEMPASPTARVMFWGLTALLVIGLLWSFIGELDVVAVAEGKTVPAGKTKVIQPLETGVVRAIHVQDGKAVKAGDLLIELDPTATGADVRRLINELVAARAEAARLDAAMYPAKPLAHFKVPPGVPAGLVAMNRTLLMSQTDEHQSHLAALDAEHDRRLAESRAVEATVTKIEKALPLLRERMDARNTLAEKGYGSRLLALELQQQMVEMENELKSLRHRREEAQAGLQALRKQRRQAESEYARTVMAQRTEAYRKIVGSEEDLLQAEQLTELKKLVAPIDGVVQQLAVHTLGGVVTPAQAVMAIVPGEATIEVEAMVLNRDIGFVAPGQEVEVKLETFLFTKYGTLPGRVISVSRDAVEHQKLGLVYPARVALERSFIDVEGRRMELGAGMSLTAEIKTDRRRMIDYVLSPITRYRHESLRER
ncbi:MAG: HlyD family type I secretion periplasmic adaptor subunit [Ferrovibrio sp.]